LLELRQIGDALLAAVPNDVIVDADDEHPSRARYQGDFAEFSFEGR
jgi:hypothetical protein